MPPLADTRDRAGRSGYGQRSLILANGAGRRSAELGKLSYSMTSHHLPRYSGQKNAYDDVDGASVLKRWR
jgi:hypothetical protein